MALELLLSESVRKELKGLSKFRTVQSKEKGKSSSEEPLEMDFVADELSEQQSSSSSNMSFGSS